MKFFVTVLFISLGWILTESIELKCSFKLTGWVIINTEYTCEVFNSGDLTITDRSDRIINTVTGTHHTSKLNSNVKGFNVASQTILYFPRDLEKFFINLEALQIAGSKMKEIRQEDLKKLPNLRIFSLHTSEIKFLEAGLFDFNTRLEFIYLANNKIAHIDLRVFDRFVGRLSTLQLGGNICKFESADNINKVNFVISKIQSGFCIDETLLPEATTTTTTPATTTTSAPTISAAQFEDLKKIIEIINDKLTTVTKELKEVKNELKTLKTETESEIQEIKNQDSDLEKQILEIKENLKNVSATPTQQCVSCAGDDQFEKRVKFLEDAVGVNRDIHNQP